MKAEILRKAQMYENTIMHRTTTNDCSTSNSNTNNNDNIKNSNNVEINTLDNNNKSNENIKLYASTLHCNRSGIYLDKSSSSATASGGTNKLCDISADDSMISLKLKSNKSRRNKNNLKNLRKYKDIFNMIKPMIAIDKL
jgi:hypothetical protein